MTKPVTIVISPRDRYSRLLECLLKLYANTDEDLFSLIVVNLGYPDKDWSPAIDFLKSKADVRIVDYGRIIPIAAMAKIRREIETPYCIFMDNDSRAEPNWLPPLIAAAAHNVAVTYPLILEEAGVDHGTALRTHLFTTELRVVEVEGENYVIEHKTFRRAEIEELPTQPTDSQAFELHCVMFNTEVLNQIELPLMTIREHLDIGLQLKALGKRIVVVPSSQVIFDNLGARADLSDLSYFDLRWNAGITHASSRLFEMRWGLKFYSEQSIYHWAKRRRNFMLLRWLHLPIFVANAIDRIYSAIKRRVFPVWDPIADPYEKSVLLYSLEDYAQPAQLSHKTHLN